MPSLKPFAPPAALDHLKLESDMIWTGSLMEIRFVMTGPVALLKGLASFRGDAAASPTEGLWETTCFEAFFGPQGSTAYYEVNAAADGRWMVFRFGDERRDRAIRGELRPATLACDLRPGRFEMTLRFDFASVDELEGKTLFATPAVVLEETSGAKSYWSLTHSAKPDFHAPAHRLLALKPA